MHIKTGTITLGELATMAGVHHRTISRHERDLGLTRIPGGGRQVIYQFAGKEESLVRQIKAPYRRGGVMRPSLVPDPEFVSQRITRICGRQPEPIVTGCLLTLAKLIWVSFKIPYGDPIQVSATRH
jgi:hypothetical protein